MVNRNRVIGVVQFGYDLDELTESGELVVKRIKNNDFGIYLMGYLYPDEFDALLNDAKTGTKLDYAHGDLIKSIVSFDNIKMRIRKLANQLNDTADLIDARDTFVQADIRTTARTRATITGTNESRRIR